MGQQQLLVLSLLIVLVGGAVVAGTHALTGEKRQNDRNLVFQDALAIVHDLQQWKRTPLLKGGGAGIDGFARADFAALGYAPALLSNRVHKSDQGCFVLRTVGPDEHAELTIYAPSCAERNYVARVVVGGPLPSDLDWSR